MEFQSPRPQSEPHVIKWQRPFVLTLVAFFIGAAIYGAWWATVANEVEISVENWIKQRRTEGIKVGYDGIKTEGFPFSVQVTVTNPSAQSELWNWQSEKLGLFIKPWMLNEAGIDLSGGHIGQITMNGASKKFSLTAEKLDLKTTLSSGQVTAIDFKGKGLKGRFGRLQQSFSLAEYTAQFYQASESLIDWNMRLRDIRVPETLRAPMGPRIQRLEGKGQLEGLIAGDNIKEAFTRWRDQGGKLDITALDIGYLPLTLSGSGTLALDLYMQPIGAFAIRAKGAMDSVDTLVEAGLIKGSSSFAAKLVLAALSKTPKGGGDRYIDLPLTLQERTLTAGPFEVIKFDAINWRK